MKPLLIVCASLLSAILGILIYDHVKNREPQPATQEQQPTAPQSGQKKKAEKKTAALVDASPELPQSLPMPEPVALAPKTPVFNWKPYTKKAFELQNLGFQYVPLRAHERTQIALHANSGIFVGVFDEQIIAAAHHQQYTLRKPDFERAECSRLSIVDETYECSPLTDNPILVIRDKRAEGSFLLGVIGVTKPGGSGVDRATAPNKVNLELGSWECAENCIP